jgi:hypothetical protein
VRLTVLPKVQSKKIHEEVQEPKLEIDPELKKNLKTREEAVLAENYSWNLSVNAPLF